MSQEKKRNWVPLIILGVVVAIAVTALVLYLRKKKKSSEDELESRQTEAPKPLEDKPVQLVIKPSNVKNNNPGNIRLSTQSWKGKVPNEKNTDKKFEQFTEKLWGVRAMTRLVKGWIDKGKASTISAIVARYAPPNENATAKYIEFVSKQTGIEPSKTLQPDKKTLKPIILAIAQMENGKGSVTPAEFEAAWKVLA